MNNEEKKELADALVEQAYERFSQNDDEREIYYGAGFDDISELPEDCYFSLYAINSDDMDKIREAFPNIIIGGLK